MTAKPGQIPVILDTDIGTDIDDMWALGFMLGCPEFDIKLITTATGDVRARARLVAKMLAKAGRTDIPIGIGKGGGDAEVLQKWWVEDYKLSDYPGKVYEDGVGAMINTIMSSSEEICVVAIGPLPTVAAALERQPRIADKARYVGMQGSLRRGYSGSEEPAAEYNVKANAQAAQKVFTADWDMTITPLDTCGIVKLQGDHYQQILSAQNPVANAIISNYRTWLGKAQWVDAPADEAVKRSSNLYDPVAVYLAMAQDFVKIESLGVRVTDDGYTVIDDSAKKIKCATQWKDMNAFKDLLVERLAGF